MLRELQSRASDRLADAEPEFLQDVNPAIEQIFSEVEDLTAAVRERRRAADVRLGKV